MSVTEFVQRMTQELEEADAAAHHAQVAYAAGKFNEYWANVGAEVNARIEAEYDSYAKSKGGTSGEGSGNTTGDGGGSQVDSDPELSESGQRSTPPGERRS